MVISFFAFTKSLEANCGQVVADFAKMVCYGAVLARGRHLFLLKFNIDGQGAAKNKFVFGELFFAYKEN